MTKNDDKKKNDEIPQEQLLNLHEQILNRIKFLNSQKFRFISVFPSLLAIISLGAYFGSSYIQIDFPSTQNDVPYLWIGFVFFIGIFVIGCNYFNLTTMYEEMKEYVLLHYVRLQIKGFDDDEIKKYILGYSIPKNRWSLFKRLLFRGRTYLNILYSFIVGLWMLVFDLDWWWTVTSVVLLTFGIFFVCIGGFVFIAKIKKDDKSSIPLCLRFNVLRRDGFSCKFCGRSALKGGLHVVHIIPWSIVKKHSLDNIVTTCKKCNLGKKGKILSEEEIKKIKPK